MVRKIIIEGLNLKYFKELVKMLPCECVVDINIDSDISLVDVSLAEVYNIETADDYIAITFKVFENIGESIYKLEIPYDAFLRFIIA